ncbi:MAG: GtrA family protein [Phenylobacterium sp.]
MNLIIRLIRKYSVSFGLYIIVGGGAALVEWIVFYLTLRLAHINYVFSAIAGFAVATYVNYLLSVRFNFVSRENRSSTSELVLVYLVSGVGLAINLAVMAIAVEWLHAWIMVGKIAGTGVAFIWNFLARQFFVFARTPRWTLAALHGRSDPDKSRVA